MQNFQGLASATLIGSMPQKDRDLAIRLILEAAPEIPVWPQLAAFPAEQMMEQYIEGLSGLAMVDDRRVVQSNAPEFEQQAYLFYEEYLAVDAGTLPIEDSRFALGEATGATFRRFLQTVQSGGRDFRALKGQVVGPFTLLAGLKDQDGRALLFDERFQDIVPKLLAMKAQWQIKAMKKAGVPVIIFLDEPALSGFGSSAFITISAELVRQLLTEVVEAVHSLGALAGVHVCANTDWLLAFDSGFDIINFDSYNYFEKFALYRKEWLEFMAHGGNIAWGIVPTLELDAIASETSEGLAERWKGQALDLAGSEVSLSKVLEHSIFTPSCGCGSLSEEMSLKVLDLLKGSRKILAELL